MPAPDTVKRLIDTFDEQRGDYHAGRYNETQVRREFIDPMFQALGWDIENTQGYAEQYKDVIHEDAVKIGGAHKAPDYSFRIGGVRKFFLEAKKPSIDIGTDVGPAYQLRRYAWSAKLSLSVLTDFEEFAAYDCRVRPQPTDKASTARTLLIPYTSYADKWDEINAIFSKDAVLKGSFDRYVESKKKMRGTAEVDAAFLTEIETWRADLAHNIALRNPNLSQRELNTAVQLTIDRIIFLRICEDRGIENYGQLQALLNGPDTYGRLKTLFRNADDRYNSGLFHFRRESGRSDHDAWTLSLTIDDKVLKQILKSLYYPDSPYVFSVVPADILGQVYEQFLGKVIHLKGKSAVVEDKPEVKKAGGVYYTPTYIVDYIVKNTVGNLLEGKTPEQISGDAWTHAEKPSNKKSAKPPLRVLDPACGSGSFLIGAYQYLLDWYLERYTESPEKYLKGKRPRIAQSSSSPLEGGPRGMSYRLTTEERKRILLTHIYGVDIDAQAVEVTKLSLLLKVLEGETVHTLQQLDLIHQRALPDLANNIKCGNALIGPDFYENTQLELTDEDHYRINVFDWKKEFPEVFRAENPGFDAVIGNPPYRRERDYKELMDEIAISEIGRRFRSPRMDLWYYFVHRGVELLTNEGLLAFIVNSYWTAGTGAAKLITFIENTTAVEEIFDLGKLKVFEKVSGQHMMFRLRKCDRGTTTTIKRPVVKDERTAESFVVGDGRLEIFEKAREDVFVSGKVEIEASLPTLTEKFRSCVELSTIGDIRQGIAENPATINAKTLESFGRDWTIGEGVFSISSNELEKLGATGNEIDLIKPYHDLPELGRYRISATPSRYLIYSTKESCPDIKRFPNVQRHLSRFKVIMSKRRETQKGSNQWWHLHWPRESRLWESPKILSVQMGRRPEFTLSMEPVYVPFSVNVFLPSDSIPESLDYILGLLNSRLLWYWFRGKAKKRGVGLDINGNVLNRAPIHRVDFSNPTDKSRHDRMVELVQRMLELHQQKSAVKTDHDRANLQRQIDATDTQIDRLVYDLYGLTGAEIKIIEAAEQ